MSLKRSASTNTPENMLSTERKSMATAAPADRKVVTPNSKQSSNPKTPLAATKSPALATRQTSEVSKVAQSRRLGASTKMPERSSTSWPGKTLSNIVKVKHKKDSGLPVAWRKELYGTRPGSAQARLENLRTALQKEVEEQKKAKASSSIAIKRSENEKCLQKEKVSLLPSQSSKGSVNTAGSASAIPKHPAGKHTNTAPEVPVVKRTNAVFDTSVKEKLEHSFEMDVDGVDTNSPKPVNSISPQVQASSSFGRYSTPVKVPDRSSSSRLNKTLSSIVKVKHKKESGLPVAWRKELYGTSPAQARLENLRATLQKEVEEQKNAKATSSVSLKRSHGQISSSKEIATTPTSKRLSNSASVTPVAAISAVPKTTAVNHTDSVPEVVQQTNTAPVGTVTEQHEDSWEMDVDETNSPEPSVPLSPAISTSYKGIEYGSLVESKAQEANHTTEEVKRDAQKNTDHASNDQESSKGVSDLKTKYKDGLSAFKDFFYCVIDTNIFIENYNDFQGFLSKKYSGSQPIVVVPYKVLHELDTVKHKKPQLAPKIIPVVKFLHQMLRAKDARVKGQHPWDDMIELMPVHSPDDSIINCALQVQSVADSENVKVVLVSNDCNMLTKALVANLNSCTMEELQTDFKF